MYVVIELKTGKFKPEYAGKLNFYLNLIERTIKDNSDNPTIGNFVRRKTRYYCRIRYRRHPKTNRSITI